MKLCSIAFVALALSGCAGMMVYGVIPKRIFVR
jgi:hypothetical protein